MAILGFRAEKGHAARIKRHGRREGVGEGTGAEASCGLPLRGGDSGAWEQLAPRVGVGALASSMVMWARPRASWASAYWAVYARMWVAGEHECELGRVAR